MESALCREVREEGGVKIYFGEKVFGKATKNRREDPNMFELLSWDVEGFEKHSFKKDEKFQQSAQAYLNMIGKHPWKSEAHENYVDYHAHSIDANPDLLLKIDNYIEQRLPNTAQPQRNSPSKPKPKDKKLPKEEERKENKYHPGNYLSPKAPSSKLLSPDASSPKQFHRSSSGDIAKSSKNIRNKEEEKAESQKKNESHLKQGQKNYGQSLEREKAGEEMSEQEQQKLIEHVPPSPLSSSRPRGGSPTVPSPPTSASRPSRTTAGATPGPSTADWSTAPTSTRTTSTPTAATTTPRTSSPTPSPSSRPSPTAPSVPPTPAPGPPATTTRG